MADRLRHSGAAWRIGGRTVISALVSERGPTPVPPRGSKGRRGADRRPSDRRPSDRRPSDRRRAQRARKQQKTWAYSAVAVVVVVVAALIVVKVSSGGASAASHSPKGQSAKGVPLPAPISAASYSELTSPPLSALAAAATNFKAPSEAYPTVVHGAPTAAGALPSVLYIGAEYCPYCATERWPLVLALSKFGTFHRLGSIHSSPTDVYPSTPTMSFYGSTYTSPYLRFTPVEIETISYKKLQTPTAAEQAILNHYDSGGSIPFVYFDGKAVLVGAEYDPQLLAGDTVSQVAAAIGKGGTTLAESVYANAGVLISDLCAVTGGKPGSVCDAFPHQIAS